MFIGVLLVAGLVEHRQHLQAKRDIAFQNSEIAFASGDFLAAQSGFTALGAYRDADERLDEVILVSEPLLERMRLAENAYLLRDYPAAIEILDDLIEGAPEFRAANELLANAKDAYRGELLLNARLAETSRDWVAVERALVTAASFSQDDEALEVRLAQVWNNHAPIVYTRGGAVFVSSPSGEDERSLTADVKARWPSRSPDRSRIAFIVQTEGGSRFDGTIMVMNADGSDLTMLVDRVMPFSAPIWSPDGTKLTYPSVKEFNEDFFTGRISLQLFDIETRIESDLTGERLNHVTGATFSPDGDHIAFVSFVMERRRGGGVDLIDGDAYIVDISTLDLTNLTEGMIEEENWIKWSPMGDQVAILTNPGDWSNPKQMQLLLVELSDPRSHRVLSTDWQLSIPVWSPDGSRIAYVQGGDTIRIWGSGGEEWIKVNGQLSPYLSWSPDGASLFAPSDQPPQPSYLIPVDGRFGEIRPVRIDSDGLNGGNGAPMWAPLTQNEYPESSD
ncbi:hypothetical protein BH23CHL5_BH23CHL5_05510 [soil metagenome]